MYSLIHYLYQISYDSESSECEVLGIPARLTNSWWFNIYSRLYTVGTKSNAVNGMCEEFKIALFWNTVAALASVP
jgi:hypothetical protein